MNLETIIVILVIIILSYLLGSIPTGYIVCKKLAGVDIREHGSGNVGAVNTKRVVGKGPALGVLIFDIIKGVIPVLIAKYAEVKYNIYPELSIFPAIIAFIAVFGHTKSIFLGFTGGKGAATGAGALLALCWPVGLIIMVLVIGLSKVIKFRSLGIFIAVPFSPILMWLFKQPLSYIIFCIVITIYMLYLYRTNLQKFIKTGENV